MQHILTASTDLQLLAPDNDHMLAAAHARISIKFPCATNILTQNKCLPIEQLLCHNTGEPTDEVAAAVNYNQFFEHLRRT